uniref:Uncharacterized protein n=1 Tax=Rhizophora mucronata TaxID=61149 RepID=A0A2P2QRK2_RHIMU
MVSVNHSSPAKRKGPCKLINPVAHKSIHKKINHVKEHPECS